MYERDCWFWLVTQYCLVHSHTSLCHSLSLSLSIYPYPFTCLSIHAHVVDAIAHVGDTIAHVVDTACIYSLVLRLPLLAGNYCVTFELTMQYVHDVHYKTSRNRCLIVHVHLSFKNMYIQHLCNYGDNFFLELHVHVDLTCFFLSSLIKTCTNVHLCAYIQAGAYEPPDIRHISDFLYMYLS